MAQLLRLLRRSVIHGSGGGDMTTEPQDILIRFSRFEGEVKTFMEGMRTDMSELKTDLKTLSGNFMEMEKGRLTALERAHDKLKIEVDVKAKETHEKMRAKASRAAIFWSTISAITATVVSTGIVSYVALHWR